MPSLRLMTEADRDLVLEWRNRPEVRHYMYTCREITAEEHRRWFDEATRDAARRLLMSVNEDDSPIGVVTFSGIDFASKVATWGLYTGPAAAPGSGSQMGLLALSYAFGPLGLEKLNSEVLDFNTRSLDFHRKLGFRVAEIMAGHYVRDGRRYDVYRLEHSREAWLEQVGRTAQWGAGR